MNLGRMAEMIARYIRGKHKPTFAMHKYDIGDKCIVVNASHAKVTGRKRG
jgi:large subunit ribosomal protein L13